VGLDRELPKFLEMVREQFREAFDIRLGKAGHPNVLEVHVMLLCEGRLVAGDAFEHFHRIVWNDVDVVDVGGRTRKAVTDCDDKPAEAVKLDRIRQLPVHRREKRTPGRT